MKTKLYLPLVAMLAFTGAATTASAQFGKPSKAEQVKLGNQAADEIRHKEKILPSYDERVKTLRRVASRLLAATDDKNSPWDYSFDVIQSKEVNAFALPGGPTFFYTGLLDKLTTEDELAGVLAHELTHVRREHWAYQYRDMQQKNLLLNLGLLVFHANRATADLASIGLDLVVNLPFSRKHETEADEVGFDTMVKAGYNPAGMADVFRLLQKESGSGGKQPEFLSDHPSDASRVKRIEDRAAKLNRTFPAQIPLNWPTKG